MADVPETVAALLVIHMGTGMNTNELGFFRTIFPSQKGTVVLLTNLYSVDLMTAPPKRVTSNASDRIGSFCAPLADAA